MFQVTAIYDGAEVGYGEGEAYEYAAQECADSVSPLYPPECVKMVCQKGILRVETPLDIWQAFTY